MDLEDYLESMRAEGRADSSGKFTYDIGRARAKLAVFFEPGRHDFIAYWVRFAVSSGASEIRLSCSPNEVNLEFAGSGPEVEAVAQLFGQRGLRMRYLQLGVIGALRQGFAEVELDTAEFVARFEPDDQSLQLRQQTTEVCQLRARKRMGRLSKWGRKLGLWLKTASAPLPVDALPFLITPLMVGGKHRPPFGFSRPQHLVLSSDPALVARCGAEPLSGRARGIEALHLIIPIHPHKISPPRLSLLVHGQDFPTQLAAGFPPDVQALVEPDQVGFDLSLRRLTEPALTPETLARVEELVRDALLETIEEGPRSLEVPLSVADWLSFQLVQQNRLHEALNLGRGLRFRLEPVRADVFVAALLERTALVSGVLRGSPDLDWIRPAETAWQHLQAQSQAIGRTWPQLVDCGVVRTPDEPWLGRATRDLPPHLSIPFYRETVVRSVAPQRLNPELLKELQKAPTRGLADSFLLARHLLKGRSWPHDYTLLQRILVAVGGQSLVDLPGFKLATVPGLTAQDRVSISNLVGQICDLAIESMDDELERHKESVAASTLSEVRLAELKSAQYKTQAELMGLRLRFVEIRAAAFALAGRLAEAHLNWRALLLELTDPAATRRIRWALQHYDT